MNSLLLPLATGTTTGKAVPHWAMREITWDKFCRALSRPAKAKETAMSYVLGTIAPGPGINCKCTEFLHRTKNTVVDRGAITLDADYCGNAGSAMVGNLKRLGVAAAAHTTWSSTVDDERYRIVIPLSRRVTPPEYAPLARIIMRLLGQDFFDHTCDQASRLMYMPAARDDSYWLGVWDGPWLDTDLWLDLAGGADVPRVVEPVEPRLGSLNSIQSHRLEWLCTNLAEMEEGNRDSYLVWALKESIDWGMDPDIAGDMLADAGIRSGLDPDVCAEKVTRILG